MNDNYKKWILKTGIIFIVILLTLTFFSNTIYSFNLPCVSVAFSKESVIRNMASGQGTVEFMETQYFYANSKGRLQLFVVEGDIVDVGDRLYSITSDRGDLQKAVDLAQNEYNMAVLRIEKIIHDMQYVQKSIDSTAFKYEQPDISGYDYEMERLHHEANRVAEVLETTKILYESGAVPKSALNEKQMELDKLIDTFVQTAQKKQLAVDVAENAKKAALDSYNDSITALQKKLSDIDYQLKEYTLDKSRIEKNIIDLKSQIENGGEIVVTADRSGKVIGALDMESRNYVDLSSFVMKLGLTDAGYHCIASFPESVDYVYVGDTISLDINSKKQYNLQGILKQVYNEDGFLKAKIEFCSDDLSGGETVTAKAEQSSPPMKDVIPNTAVRYDPSQNQYYILYIEKVKKTVGYEYYARPEPIYIQMQDTQNTGCVIFTDERPAIIINSDKPVNTGDRVRVVDGSDIIEIR